QIAAWGEFMQGNRHHILLATNTASLSAQYQHYLDSRNVQVRCVYTGRDLIQALHQSGRGTAPYELVFMDLDLPDGDAAWVVKQLGEPDRHDFHGPVLVCAPSRTTTTPDDCDPRLAQIRAA